MENKQTKSICTMCCKCFDRILDTILPMFKKNPLSEYEIVDEDGKLICKPIQ